MRAHTQRQLAALVMTGAIAGGLTAFGCSLGLDASLIGKDAGESGDGMPPAEGGEGSMDDSPAPPKDGMADGESGAPATVGACATDKDCQSAVGDAGGCVTSAKCDKTWHVCMLDVCPSAMACHAEVCVQSTGSCSVPDPYGFAPSSFKVTYGGVGSGGPASSIAAVWPFVFVATNSGVIAYDVVDPTSGSPLMVPVHGVPFLVTNVIAVGRRVYFVTGPKGPGPTFHQAIAWVDVPQNPFLTALQASSAWVAETTVNFSNALTNGSDGMFFVYNTPDQLWQSADLHPPFTDSTAITTYASNNFPMGETVWTSSFTRLVAGRYDAPTNMFWGSLVTAAGTQPAQATAELQITGLGEVANQWAVTPGDDGSVLMSAAPYDVTDAGPMGIASSCVTWLIDSSITGNFDASKCPALETYSPPTSATVVAPPGWVDKNTALALAGASSNPGASTSVHVVTKSPAAVAAGKVAYLPVGTGSVGVATSSGFGYVLTQDDPMNLTCTVYVFAPSCGGGAD